MYNDTPVASYDNQGLLLNRNVRVGTTGFSGTKASLTTSLSGSNNDLVITAHNARDNTDPAIQIQYAVLGNNAPGFAFEGGYPAQLIPASNLGFQLMTKTPGTDGNRISLTLVDPYRVAPLEIHAPALDDIVVQLARSASGLTTTPAQLVAALNARPEIAQRMVAYISDSSVVPPLPAMAQTFFRGGSVVPGLVLVSLANTNGTITATASSVAALLNGTGTVQAHNSGSDNGSGVVTALAPTALSGGSASRGDLAREADHRKDWGRVTRSPGNPMGKESTNTIEIRSSRTGAPRNDFGAPAQERVITSSSNLNYQKERGPKSSRWF